MQQFRQTPIPECNTRLGRAPSTSSARSPAPLSLSLSDMITAEGFCHLVATLRVYALGGSCDRLPNYGSVFPCTTPPLYAAVLVEGTLAGTRARSISDMSKEWQLLISGEQKLLISGWYPVDILDIHVVDLIETCLFSAIFSRFLLSHLCPLISG